MNDKEIASDIAYGEGAQYMIENNWIDPSAVTGHVLRRDVNDAYDAYDAYRRACKELNEIAERVAENG